MDTHNSYPSDAGAPARFHGKKSPEFSAQKTQIEYATETEQVAWLLKRKNQNLHIENVKV
jgi:hypothetical protein